MGFFSSSPTLFSVTCMSLWWCVCVAPRVSESVEKNRQQLQSATDRIRLAQARVDKIKGSKKATKVTRCPYFERRICIFYL